MSYTHSKKFNLINWQMLFSLWSLQGLISFFWLLLLPTNTKSEVALGFSAARLALLGSSALITCGSFFLFIQSRRSLIQQNFLDLEKRHTFWDVIYLASIAAPLLALALISVLYNLQGSPANASYALRLSPLAVWVMLSGLELAILLSIKRQGNVLYVLKPIKPQLRVAIIILSFLLFLGTIVTATKIGITQDGNRGAPAIPFLEWQILLALLVVAFFAFYPRINSTLKHKWIVLAIYIFTVALWLSQPINTAYTATAPRAPNFEIYPFSDPLLYAQYAQSALAGNGFVWPEVPARPFYIAFLTWLHLLGGQNYNTIIVLQTLVLAAFPASLYLIGEKIGGRPLGLGLSLLLAFRDVNANVAVPFASNVTYSKLFLSELPAALFLSIITLLCMRWLRQAKRPAWIPFLIGGLLGTATLVRTQSITVLAVILLISFLIISNRKQWLIGSTLLMLGLAITLAPWLIRNYFATGGFILDNPLTQTMTMTRRWSGSTGNEIFPRLAGESDADYSSRMTTMAIGIFKQNPGFILKTAANHFINSEIASLLAFPLRDTILSPAELLQPQHEFWKINFKVSQLPLLVFYLFLFSLGVATAYHHHRLIGLLPLGFGLVYNLWTALFFSSGERFIVPLDWSISLYQIFGLITLGGLLLSFTMGARENASAWILNPVNGDSAVPESDASSRRRFFLSLSLILFLSAFLPLTEFIFPQKYPPLPSAEIVQQIGLTPKEGETVFYGRAIYPRYYYSGEGELTAKIGYQANETPRLVFFLIGPKSGLVVFELKDAPDFFPNISDVYIIGTQTDYYFSPRIVKVKKDDLTEVYINK